MALVSFQCYRIGAGKIRFSLTETGFLAKCFVPITFWCLCAKEKRIFLWNCAYRHTLVTKSGQVTPPPKKFAMLQQLQFLSNHYETFRISDIMRPSIATKRISWIFDFGDLRSGQFCDLSILRQWEKYQIPHLRIRSGDFIIKWVLLSYGHDPCPNCCRWPS